MCMVVTRSRDFGTNILKITCIDLLLNLLIIIVIIFLNSSLLEAPICTIINSNERSWNQFLCVAKTRTY